MSLVENEMYIGKSYKKKKKGQFLKTRKCKCPIQRGYLLFQYKIERHTGMTCSLGKLRRDAS